MLEDKLAPKCLRVLMFDACPSVFIDTQIKFISFNLLIIDVINNIRLRDVEPIYNNNYYLYLYIYIYIIIYIYIYICLLYLTLNIPNIHFYYLY